MKVLLISTYELGHQPFGLASPAAWLAEAGAEVSCLDLAVESMDEEAIRAAGLIAVYLPMHTATRLASTVSTADQGSQSGGSCLLLWPLRAAERGVPADGVRWWDGPRRRIRERPGQPVQTVVGQRLRRFGAAVGARHFPYQAGLPRATAPRPAAAIALCICGPGPREASNGGLHRGQPWL